MPLYLATQNSDQTEGRGSQVGIGLFDNEAAAVEAVKGRGVMGYGDGEVYLILDPAKVYSSAKDWAADGHPAPGINPSYKKVYGYRKDWQGKWSYGFVDNRDAPTEDPEYKEYMRLKAKFGVDD